MHETSLSLPSQDSAMQRWEWRLTQPRRTGYDVTPKHNSRIVSMPRWLSRLVCSTRYATHRDLRATFTYTGLPLTFGEGGCRQYDDMSGSDPRRRIMLQRLGLVPGRWTSAVCSPMGPETEHDPKCETKGEVMGFTV
ncbi:hypothetical protein IF1G_01413 [Cordyceps javanica]|uniref:Uncharacterized protein n=1 Tax=Cordyceps javanica TaxID=43265 RepID=A0A545VBX1_9HYPO|nr:hypothetical protein IF1G_01413 [Cordyceps javanica]